ncbi:MAG: hypothetical protein KAI72_01755, partial [Candidatus Pacebacteria bacterium]|nr:hypothetical protein [Candidatus Paceibacterota bacterium]
LSILALSFYYHYRPQTPTGGKWGMLGAYIFYWGAFITTMGLGIWIGMDIFHLFFIKQFMLTTFTAWAGVKIVLAGIMIVLGFSLLRTSVGNAWITAAAALRKFPLRIPALIFAIVYSVTGPWGFPVLAQWIIKVLPLVLIVYEDKIIKKATKGSLYGMFISEKITRKGMLKIALPLIRAFFGKRIARKMAKRYMKGRQRIGKAFVHFTLSTAFGRKVRESFDGSEWFQALLRWSGGSQQQMGDKTMQEITDLGPGSVVAKETRAVNSRFFTSTRTSRWFGILLAVSTIFGFSPYQGILLGLIVVSAVSNQILTFNGLIALLESKRFSKTAAFIGAGIIGALFAFRPDMIIYGALIGGFTQGLSLWIYRRGRDFVRFPLQLVVTVMGPR